MKKASDLLYGKRKQGPGPKKRPTPQRRENLADFYRYMEQHLELLSEAGYETWISSDYEDEALCWICVELSEQDDVRQEEIQFNNAIRLGNEDWVVDAECIVGKIWEHDGVTFKELLELEPKSKLIELLAEDIPFDQLTKTG